MLQLRYSYKYVSRIYFEKIKNFIFNLVGVVVALILDYNNSSLANYSGGTRFMIFMLETANTRFAGYSIKSTYIYIYIFLSRLCYN